MNSLLLRALPGSAILALTITLSRLPAASGQTYLIQTLPPPLANGNSMGFGINEAGVVVGVGRGASNLARALRWTNDTPTELGVLTGFSVSAAHCISNNDRAVGRSGPSCNAALPTLWEASQMVALPDVPGLAVEVYRINDAGIAVGEGMDSCINFWNNHAFQWQNDGEDNWTVSPLPPLTGDFESGAYDVNAANVVVGFSGDSGSVAHVRACRWDNGIASLIPDLGGNYSIGYALNDMGQFAGYSRTPSGAYRAYVSDGITATDLGTLPGYAHSAAERMNNAGTVIGFAFNGDAEDTTYPYFFPSTTQRAFVWRNGVLHDLNNLIPPGSGWTSLNAALDINELGQITGYGVLAGRNRAFRLSPVRPGDLNCDLRVNLDDVPHFVAALLGTGFSGCDITRADMNLDGLINGLDTKQFTDAVIAP